MSDPHPCLKRYSKRDMEKHFYGEVDGSKMEPSEGKKELCLFHVPLGDVECVYECKAMYKIKTKYDTKENSNREAKHNSLLIVTLGFRILNWFFIHHSAYIPASGYFVMCLFAVYLLPLLYQR